MARIVAVHGIGQQLSGRHSLEQLWLPALRDGVERTGAPAPRDGDLACAFYGDLFRRAARKGLGEPSYTAGDIQDGFEAELLQSWWQAASEAELQVPGPGDRTKLRTPDTVQRALNALSRSRFFAGLAERALIGFVKQVHRYFAEPELRALARARVAQEIGPDTQVVVGHSLGSVVAYEALCAHSSQPARAFVTLGSPLGIRNLIFDRLEPTPRGDSGAWPDTVQRWTNVADGGDVVALVKLLAPRFGERVEDLAVHNGAKPHDVSPYLTAKETGRAIAAALEDRDV